MPDIYSYWQNNPGKKLQRLLEALKLALHSGMQPYNNPMKVQSIQYKDKYKDIAIMKGPLPPLNDSPAHFQANFWISFNVAAIYNWQIEIIYDFY